MSKMISHALHSALTFLANFSLEEMLQTMLRDLHSVVPSHNYRVIIASKDIKVFTVRMLRCIQQLEEH